MTRPGRLRRWGARLGLLFLIVVVVGIGARVALVAALPSLVNGLVEDAGLEVSWSELALVLRRGELELDGLVIAASDEPEQEPLVSVEHLRVDLALLETLRGRPVLRRVYVDRLRVLLERRADGSQPLLDRVARLAASFAPESPAPPKESGPLELGLPLELRALGVQGLELRWRNETMTPAVDVSVFGTLHAENLGAPQHDAVVELGLSSPQLLDWLWISCTGRSAGPDLTAELELTLAGFRPRVVEGFLAQSGLTAVAGEIDGRLELALWTEAATGRADALAVAAEITNLEWTTDEETVAEVRRLAAGAAALSPAGLEQATLELEGARFELALSRTGPEFFGLALAGGQPSAPEPDEPDAGAPWPVSVKRAAIRDTVVRYRDRTTVPELEQALYVDAVELGNLALGPDVLQGSADFAASVRAPGLVELLRVEGVLAPDGSGRRLDSTVRAEGIALGALERQLQGANLEATLDAGTLDCRVFAHGREDDAGLRTVSFGLEDLSFADEAPLIEVDRLAVEDVEYDRSRSFLRIGNVELAGTRATAAMEPDGSLTALGLHTVPAPSEGVTRTRNQTLIESIDTLAAGVLPRRETVVALINALLPYEDVRVELGRLDWHDGRFALSDLGPTGEFSFDVKDLGASVEGFGIGGRQGEREEASLRVWLRSPGDFDEISLAGTFAHRLTPLELDTQLTLSAERVAQAFLEPLLRLQGLEPTFGEGRFGATLAGRLSIENEVVSAEGVLSNLFLDSNVERLAGVERLALQDLRLDETGLSAGEIELVRPLFRAERGADGRVTLLGVRPLPQAAAAQASKRPAPGPITEQPAAGVTLPPERAGLERFRLTEGVFEWSDAATGLTLAVSLDGQLDDVRLEDGALGAKYSLQLAADGQERLALDGAVGLGAQGLNLIGALAANDLSGDRIESYLPPGVTLDLDAGRVAFEFEGAVRATEDGALAGEVAVRELEIAEQDEPPLGTLKEARVRLSRADLTQGEILLEEVSVLGTEVRVVRSVDGTLRVLGLHLDPSAAPAAPADDAAEAAAAEQAPRRGPPRLRSIALERLDLELARLELVEEGAQDGALLELGARLTSLAPLDLLTPESEQADTLRLQLRGFLRPFVGELQVDLDYTPALLNPALSAKVSLDGLDGAGLLAVLPQLEGRVDASGLLAESLDFRAEAALELGQRGDGFGVVVSVHDLVVRDESGEPIGGVERIYVDAPEVELKTGDVHIRSLGLLSPSGRTTLGESELGIAGVIFKAQPPIVENLDGEPQAPPSIAEVEPPPVPENPLQTAPARPEGGELVIDEFTISGIDLLIVDAATDPPTALPVDDLYVDVRGISSRALQAARPVRFDAYANAGVAEVPGHESGRVAFEELAVEGWMVLHPVPTGWFRIDVAALELLPLRMRAKEAGINLKSGMLDTSVRASLQKELLRVDSRSTFTDLVVSESEAGAIQSTLKLPVPLNVAIALLENSNGELVVPLSFTMNAQQLSRSQLLFTLSATLSQVLVKAIAQAPFRIGNTATQLIGLSSRAERRPPRVERLTFEQGDATLEAQQRTLVAELRKILSKGKSTVILSHEMGVGDRALVVERATPSREETLLLVKRLRQERRKLARAVTLATARGRTRLAIGDDEGWHAAAEETSALLSELSRIADALEEMSQLLRLDAEEHRVHREALLMAELGWLRIGSVYGPLTEGLTPELANRVLLRRPLARVGSEEPGGAVVVTVRERK